MTNSLSDQQLQRLRRQLMDDYDQLRETVRDELMRTGEEHYIDLAGRVHDEAEESVADLLADLDLTMLNRHKNELRDIEAAFGRMDIGHYGTCVDCGDDIAYERLQASPTAIRCRDCQEQYENRERVNRPTL